MLGRIKELFAPVLEVEVPEALDTEERVRLATCVLLLEVATVDNEYSAEESAHLLDTLRKQYRLSCDDAEELIEVARKRRAQSFDLWKFTNQINQACSIDEKLKVIEEIWGVIYADGTLDGHEDHLVHKLARLLNLTHRQLIDAKLVVLEERRANN